MFIILHCVWCCNILPPVINILEKYFFSVRIILLFVQMKQTKRRLDLNILGMLALLSKMEIVARQSVGVCTRRWQFSGDKGVALCSNTFELKKVLEKLLLRNLQYLGLSAQLRAPCAIVREVKQQWPILLPQHSIYFCFKRRCGENSMSKWSKSNQIY